MVDEYAADAKAGGEFPPLVVYEDDAEKYWLSRGFHRLAAYRKAGIEEALCEIREGTRLDALVDACGSNGNREHGLRRSQEDKRRAAVLLITAYPKWSARKIAEAAELSHTFVSEVKREMETSATNASGGQADSSAIPSSGNVATPDSEKPGEPVDSPPSNSTGETPDEDVSPAVVVERVTPEACLGALVAITKNLTRVRDYLSSIMASPFGADLREQLTRVRSLPIDRCPIYQTGEAIDGSGWGSVNFAVHEYTTAELSLFGSLVGEMKVFFQRAAAKTVERTDDKTDPWDLGKELKDGDNDAIEF